MMLSLNYGFWEFWDNDPSLGFFGSQKCVFDGLNKLIIVSDGVSEIDIKTDVYSDWKQWAMARTNLMFLPAIRSTGGDPIDTANGIYTGDIYFLINGWKLIVDLNKVKITGILYSDDYVTPYYDSSLNEVYPASVSSLVNTYEITRSVVTTEDVQTIVQSIWDANIANYLNAGSTGKKLNDIPTASSTADAVWSHTTANTLFNNIGFIKGIEGGRWKIANNQMIFYNDDNITELARFDLTDSSGNPTQTNVFERTRV